jgi:hypothetical protein
MTNARLALILGFGWSVSTTALFLLQPAPALPGSSSNATSPDPLALAAAVLLNTNEFASFAVGVAGTTSTQALAWRVIMQSPAADSVFKGLLAVASRPGQLYALAGLRLIDSAAYARGAAYQRSLGGEVSTLFGCIGGRQSVAAILDGMDRGVWTRELLVGRAEPIRRFTAVGVP